jgi:hypothetical protein
MIEKKSLLGLAMLNLEVFQELCRRASQETNPAELETLKEALLFMLRTEEIELQGVERIPMSKPH